MDLLQGRNLEPPSDDPSTYCRLCLSTTELQLISSLPESLDLVQLIWKQLEIELTALDGFSCAICTLCVQKLEELSECNDDGLLNEWDDNGEFLQYKKMCQAVNTAIENWRSAPETSPDGTSPNQVPIVLPFQKLSDGRYKCKECSHMVFDEISACVDHHQEVHQKSNSGVQGDDLVELPAFNSSEHKDAHSATKRSMIQLDEPATNGKVGSHSSNSITEGTSKNKRPCFKCQSCSESFDCMDKLVQHRSVHVTKTAKKRNFKGHCKKQTKLMVPGNDTKCKKCKVQFPDKKAFYAHLNGAHEFYICYVCDQSFDSAAMRLMHQANHWNLNDIINPFLLGRHSFHCNVCLEKFRTKQEIRLHYQTKHDEPETGNEEGPSVGVPEKSTFQTWGNRKQNDQFSVEM